MSYIFQGTVWPDHPVPDTTKQLIARLLQLGDSNDPMFGPKISEEIFTPNGVLDHGSYKFEGKEALATCRTTPKPGSQVVKSRHRISRVYAQTSKADDLMAIAELVVDFDNGKVVHNNLAFRAVVDDSNPDLGPRLSLWAIYIDSRPMAEASQS